MSRIVPATPETIAEAAAILRRGGLVAFPTETVYGLGANALDPQAVAAIFAAKGRPATNPIIVHVADVAGCNRVATSFPEAASRLAERFWPGPLTLVLPKRPEVPEIVTAGGPTVAVRVPAHPVALNLLKVAGVPIAAPSANRSTQLSPTTAEHVRQSMGDRVELILDGGPCSGGIESTVVDVSVLPPRLLRPGLIDPSELEAILGPLAQATKPATRIARSPGQMDRHYAPRTPVILGNAQTAERESRLHRKIAFVTWESCNRAEFLVERMPTDPRSSAARLYALLHALDEQNFDTIVIDLPPNQPEWLAIRDRLARAACREAESGDPRE